MDRFLITGPNRLSGRVRAAGAKNAALPALAATLLTDSPMHLDGVPMVRDIQSMRLLLESLGIDSAVSDGRFETSPRSDLGNGEAPYEQVKQMRASVLVLGPLLTRRGRARVSLPGGCAIGVRPIDQHLAALEAMGAEVTLEHGYVTATAKRLRGARFRFAMPTVTGTENALMAACLATGSSRLEGCACEPEIGDLATLLRAMGAHISGDGTPTIEVEGVDTLHGARHTIVGDRIEAGTYLIGGAISGGDVRVDAQSFFYRYREGHPCEVFDLAEECAKFYGIRPSKLRVDDFRISVSGDTLLVTAEGSYGVSESRRRFMVFVVKVPKLWPEVSYSFQPLLKEPIVNIILGEPQKVVEIIIEPVKRI